ncbi:hypothetical protein Q7C36_015745 [Tachysurus vachellii]|uniref:Uncharacterized protein n=1 Tax=Tachysurus vachellii TaxID=175792 RepID=A0AA88MB19_TACVA|nr:hypothetical protein Q7C36_015745 [Tachysurus vachellii]
MNAEVLMASQLVKLLSAQDSSGTPWDGGRISAGTGAISGTHLCFFQEASPTDTSLAARTKPGICVCYPDFPKSRLRKQRARQTPGGGTQS